MNDVELRGRKMPNVNGCYIEGKLCGLKIFLTVDGRAMETMVSSRIYKQIPKENRPELSPRTKGTATGAGGAPIQIWGVGKFQVQLGSITLTREMAVAEITDDILLGDDILHRDPEGHMDIVNSEQVLKFKGMKIPLETVGLPERALRITCIKNEMIPGMSEKFIEGFLERPDEEYSEHIKECMLIEGNTEFEEMHGCVVTPVVVRVVGKVTTQVKILNPTSTDV